MPHDSQAIDELLNAAMEKIESRRRPIESTYRVQFHAGFTFRDAASIVPYLAKLGITHLYASPYLKATPGSMHGYDVIDHCRLNPELGSMEDFDALVATLRAHGMSHIADIVPNHVGIATNENTWWNDVLENGPASIYANYFDINWIGLPLSDLGGRVLMPILGAMYGEELEQGKLKLTFEGGGFFVSYYERKLPISPKSYSAILPGNESLREIKSQCDALPDRCEGAAVARERHQRKQEIKRKLAELAETNRTIADQIAANLQKLNGTPDEPGSFDRLDDLLRHQCFRLASWKTAPDEINYRRFFDVNSLAALSMERLEVFEATHGFILGLLAQDKIAGLRVDHPDGLYDPEIYFKRLQSHYVMAIARELFEGNWEEIKPWLLKRLEEKNRERPLYILGEKILALDEPLARTWPIDGTSGYEFLNMTSGLFVDASAAGKFDRIYQQWIADDTSYGEIIYQKKKMILQISLASELNMLAIQLKRIAQRSRYGIDFSLRGLREALRELIACFGVYRTYVSEAGASDADRLQIDRALDAATKRNPKTEPAIFRFIRNILLAEGEISHEERTQRLHFAGKFQQLSSPVTAKGIEDTAFYIYNRLASLNEVGGNPGKFGVGSDELHEFFQQRQRDWPRAMSTLSTHDTKRSEDVRARINALSEFPEEWELCLRRWAEMNTPHRATIDGKPAPDRNEEYALYQTLLGAWPIESTDMQSFYKRIHAYIQKFMREARVHTSWTDPDKPREKAVERFIDLILDESRSAEFLKDFRSMQRRISRVGMFNSLAQTLLKLTAPGVPDTYQGNEIWDFSLVDPDNRRPVDFQRQRKMLDEPERGANDNSPASLESGRLKLAIHQKVLHLRRQFPGLFTGGEYLPIQTAGSKARHLFAFARMEGSRVAIVAAPRLLGGLIQSADGMPCGSRVWGDTSIQLPEKIDSGTFRNYFSGAAAKTLMAAELFAQWPVALLIREE